MKRALLIGILGFFAVNISEAATYRTANFAVEAASESVAKQVGDAAEVYRAQVIRRWFNDSPTDWNARCRIEVQEYSSGGSGWTYYTLQYGEPHDLEILLQGEILRLLESVLPHEVTHAVLVKMLGKPLPRWADEGLALLSESESHRTRIRLIAGDLQRSSNLTIDEVLTLANYPPEGRELYGFYAASLSLTEYLMTLGDHTRLLNFAAEGSRIGWDAALQQHYSVADTQTLETAWRTWARNSQQYSAAYSR